ncbi:hypothetical protein BDW59DRAFT_112550 [Aspergillus cavernicola]|uniref:DUF6590 domain-containing protein n=1 Tax=Aspergillus cavernicola TaxID=176166 RepID=A0ABR4HZH0_9EURO
MSGPYPDDYYDSEDTVTHAENNPRRGSRHRSNYADPLDDEYQSRARPRAAENGLLPNHLPEWPPNPEDEELTTSHYIPTSSRSNNPTSAYRRSHASGYDRMHDYQSGSRRSHSNVFPPFEPPQAPLGQHRSSLGGGEIRPELGHPEHFSQESDLDPRYAIQRRTYYSPGRVFSILWHENDGRGVHGTHISAGPQYRGRYGEPIYSTIRRMVVFKSFGRYSWCFSISTYNGRGVSKPGVDPSKHAIVYMTGTQPTFQHNEPTMTKTPLEVYPERYDEGLDRMSRLNYGKIYTVEHNVKVLPIGAVIPESMPKFLDYARFELEI